VCFSCSFQGKWWRSSTREWSNSPRVDTTIAVKRRRATTTAAEGEVAATVGEAAAAEGEVAAATVPGVKNDRLRGLGVAGRVRPPVLR